MYRILFHLVFYSCSLTLDLSFFMMLLSIDVPIHGSPVFYSCSSILDLSFFMMLLSICEPLLCFFDPSWWSRHMDSQVYTIKLQPGFCDGCVLQCFADFWTNFLYDVLSNFAIATLSPPCVLCVSRHIDFETSCLVCKSVNELSMTSSKNF